MATPIDSRSNSLMGSGSSGRFKHWISHHKLLLVVAMMVIIFVAWFNSDFWPWPSGDRINARLNKVIDICMDNESSTECKDIQKRYGMTFRYCRSFADTKTKDYYGQDGAIHSLPYYPTYGVAWEGSSSTPPENKIIYGNGESTTLPSKYFGCTEHME